MWSSSLACLMFAKCGRLSSLLDLVVHCGTGALAMDLEPGRGLTDAIENPSRIDGLFIERAIVKASEKQAILSAEAPISQPMMTDGAAFYQLQGEFREIGRAPVRTPVTNAHIVSRPLFEYKIIEYRDY